MQLQWLVLEPDDGAPGVGYGQHVGALLVPLDCSQHPLEAEVPDVHCKAVNCFDYACMLVLFTDLFILSTLSSACTLLQLLALSVPINYKTLCQK